MVLDLKTASASSPLDALRSHPHKFLRVHTNGVFDGVTRHTQNRTALLAALWHDVGKINPHFQSKFAPPKTKGYDHHAYLSALCFLSYYYATSNISEIGLNSKCDLLVLLALISHHHGHLPYLRQIFNVNERSALFTFIGTGVPLPASAFIAQYGFVAPFEVSNPALPKKWDDLNAAAGKQLGKIPDGERLDFWLDTQFSFAALIESDKRDASDNKDFKRDVQLEWARGEFKESLERTFEKLEKPEITNGLNLIRTEIRKEAVLSLSKKLKTGERVFSLTAPTGAGKTFTLLALANEIRAQKGNLAVIYGLPFLSITEQVEKICREIWKSNPDFVSRFDSRSFDPGLDDLLERAETDEDAARELAQEDFSGRTFDAAFSITTFVQIFETLLSNRNSTLLKLPNFAKTIFLLDEIQALPPRLYLFFTAYLQRFCEKIDCYAILSTATMPHLGLVAQKDVKSKRDPKTLFENYKEPPELLDYKKFFAEKVFARYRIEPCGEWSLARLAEEIEKEKASTLIILNTIADTRALYEKLTENRELKGAKIILLNTHFVLDDRRAKIEECKKLLKEETRVILISTQLIEAGVDVDFPVVMRDLCPLPNLIQSAGRCNRNGKLDLGRVVFFTLVDEEGKPRANSIYRLGSDQSLLRQTIEALPETTPETNLLQVQREFFKRMAHNFEIGRHTLGIGPDRDENASLIEQIRDFNFPLVGTFRLIDEVQFGEQFQIYVPRDRHDNNWEKLEDFQQKIVDAFKTRASLEEKGRLKIALSLQLKAMSGRILTVRCSPKKLPALLPGNGESLCGLWLLPNWENDYNSDSGLQFAGAASAII